MLKIMKSLKLPGSLHPSWLWQQSVHNPPWTQRKHFFHFESIFAGEPCFSFAFVQASLVVAVLVLLYCLYVVQDWLDMLTHDQVILSCWSRSWATHQTIYLYPHLLHQSAFHCGFNQGVKKKLAAMGRSGTGIREGGDPSPGAPPPSSQSTLAAGPSASTTLASPAPLTSSPPPPHASAPLPSAPPPPSSSSVNSSQRSRPLPKTVITRQPITGAPVPQTSLWPQSFRPVASLNQINTKIVITFICLGYLKLYGTVRSH